MTTKNIPMYTCPICAEAVPLANEGNAGDYYENSRRKADHLRKHDGAKARKLLEQALYVGD